MASIRFEHVYKRFGNVEVLKDLTMSIRDQEFLVLVGPSGCGKSTALRCLAGLEEVSAGTITIGQRVVNNVPPQERDIAMVFQGYALYPHMSVADNMAFALTVRKTPRQEINRRVKEAADILGIGDLLHRLPAELSGGQQQRVALGRAIVRDPVVFLMDEPLSNLDAKLRGQMRIEISKLHQRLKTTFIYVTHDQTEAMTMGNRIAVMREGVLQQLDTPQKLYDEPGNMFVASFIGSPAMNFFSHATITHVDGGLVIDVPGAFVLPIPQHKAQLLGEHVGRRVVFGIRPEDVYDAQFMSGGVNTTAHAHAQVGVIEPLGSEVYVYMEQGRAEFVGRFDPRTAATPGKPLEIVFDMNRMHVFDHDTERALI
jgi:multiple sugar transport system ATP-binding protein